MKQKKELIKCNLEQIMKEKDNIKQKDIVNKTNISKQHISNIVHNRDIPNLFKALKISEAIGMTVNEIFEIIKDEE